MILQIPSDMRRVSAATYRWFVKSLRNPREMQFSNGTGYYEDERLVAAKFTNDQHYVKVKR
jgi:hypothetical protein